MGGQQLIESQGAKKNGKPLPRTHTWNSSVFTYGIFFPFFFFLKKIQKIQTTDFMTAGIFLTVFSPFGSKGMGFAVQHLKECNTNTVCSLEKNSSFSMP